MGRAGHSARAGGGKGQGRGGIRSGRGDSGAPRFEAREPDQLTGFDELTETKFGKKQAKLAKLSGGQGALMLDEDELEEALNLLDMWSDDDDDLQRLVRLRNLLQQDKETKSGAIRAAADVEQAQAPAAAAQGGAGRAVQCSASSGSSGSTGAVGTARPGSSMLLARASSPARTNGGRDLAGVFSKDEQRPPATLVAT